MNRITTTLTHAAAAAALGAAALGAAAQSHDLTVVSWGGAYQDGQKEVYFKPFNAAGTKLLDESWDGGLGVLRTKIKGGNNAGTSCRSRPTSSRSAATRACTRSSTSARSAARRATCRAPCTPAASARSSTTWCSPTTATR